MVCVLASRDSVPLGYRLYSSLLPLPSVALTSSLLVVWRNLGPSWSGAQLLLRRRQEAGLCGAVVLATLFLRGGVPVR